MFFIGTGCSVISVLILFFFNERLDIERMDSKGLVVWKPKGTVPVFDSEESLDMKYSREASGRE